MPRIKLTDKVVRHITTEKSSEEFVDQDFGQGEFGVRVSNAGKKSFFIRYRIDGRKGKRNRFPLGTYPAITLASAREKALQTIADTQSGKDPARIRKSKKNENSVTALYEAFMKQKEASYVRTTYINYISMWKKDCENVIGDIKPSDVERRDIVELLDQIEERTNAPHMVNRTRTMLMSMFNWAVAKDLCKYNPVLGVPKAQKRELPGERFLSRTEIKTYWMQSEEMQVNERVFWRLLLLLALRPGEVMKLQWSWIDGEVLTIPASHVKNKREHKLYLTESARAEVEALKPFSGKSDFLFPGQTFDDHCKTYKEAHGKMVVAMKAAYWTARDIRRTCETQMRTFIRDSEGISRVLNHDVSQIRKHYDRGDYFDRKREVLIHWTQWLKEVIDKSEKKVVNLSEYRG